jgi:hypothetical protein
MVFTVDCPSAATNRNEKSGTFHHVLHRLQKITVEHATGNYQMRVAITPVHSSTLILPMLSIRRYNIAVRRITSAPEMIFFW